MNILIAEIGVLTYLGKLVEVTRNRSEGWKHAKKDGHANEFRYASTLKSSIKLKSLIKDSLNKELDQSSLTTQVDGSKHVPSIFGDMTVSKVDIVISCNPEIKVNISLKKSLSGQAWLVSVDRFLSAIEHYLGHELSFEVKAGLSLFIGGSNIVPYKDIFDQAIETDKKFNPNLVAQELRQSRLLGKSLTLNCPEIWKETKIFLSQNIKLITKLTFAKGLAASENDSAELLIYNKVEDEEGMFVIAKLISEVEQKILTHPVSEGPRNGGSTLQFPTGFLQMHHPQKDNLIQFHHQYDKIHSLLA